VRKGKSGVEHRHQAVEELGGHAGAARADLVGAGGHRGTQDLGRQRRERLAEQRYCQQQRDEHHRHGHGQRHRERAERGVSAFEHGRVDLERRPHDLEEVVREREVLARERRERDHPIDPGP